MTTEIEELKAHLTLAVELLRTICESAEIDTAETKLVVKIKDKEIGSKSFNEIISMWERMSS